SHERRADAHARLYTATPTPWIRKSPIPAETSKDGEVATMFRKSRVISTVSLCAAFSLVAAACSSGDSGDDGPTTIEFAQWWGTELPDGELESIISDFEDETGIQVEITSQPSSTVKDQLVAGAVSGTMPDVMGLDGNWVYDFNKQGALADMRPLAEDA